MLHLFSRRTMQRGAGVSMALPWMESLTVWGDEASAREPGSQAPVRLAILFAGNGFHSREWWARGEGAGMQFGKVLQPLHDFRERTLFIQGLYNAEALKGNIHSSQTGNLLSGAPLAAGGEIRSGTSVDQALAFDRLFKDNAQKGDTSVLDAVLADARDLRHSISRTDQQKLDEYLNSVREVEQRIEQSGKRGELQGWRPALSKPDISRPADGIPQDIAEHMRLMCDLLVLGFQTDTTRLCTLKLNNDHSSLRFPHLGVDYMIHHLLSHSDTEDWLKVNQFFLEQLAYIARRLDAIQKGERTALDNSMLMLCSSMLTGSHDATQLPVVVVGGGGGTIRGGRGLKYTQRKGVSNAKSHFCNVNQNRIDSYSGNPVRRIAQRTRLSLL